ncbi:MAG: hypothetical protein DRP01_02485 [Archaeoglobales archaeon]|nr:MAG: hypothetical protein DRP01_02485 [Archaeoglobales archaeon]
MRPIRALRFECLRCGRCCVQTRRELHGLVFGIQLWPEEKKLLTCIAKERGIKITVKPQFASRSKSDITLWQLADEPCPFYDETTRSCTIYPYRPLACRAYPVCATGGLDKYCEWTKRHEHLIPFRLEGPEPIWNAIIVLRRTMLEQTRPSRWVFDLRTEKWYKVEDVIKEVVVIKI